MNIGRVLERTGAEFAPAAAQALFDLGATVCLARVPRCGECPLAGDVPLARTDLRAAAQAERRSRARSASGARRCFGSSPPSRSRSPIREAVESLLADGLVVVEDDRR